MSPEPIGFDHLCGLETGHEGCHFEPLAADAETNHPAVSASEDVWWLRWSDDGAHHEFVARPFCPAPHPTDPENYCAKPADHPPGHTWILV